MKYKVKFEENSGVYDCVKGIKEFDTRKEAEEFITKDLLDCMDFYSELDWNCARLGNKTEFWIRGGNEYASWTRLWI